MMKTTLRTVFVLILLVGNVIGRKVGDRRQKCTKLGREYKCSARHQLGSTCFHKTCKRKVDWKVQIVHLRNREKGLVDNAVSNPSWAFMGRNFFFLSIIDKSSISRILRCSRKDNSNRPIWIGYEGNCKGK